jgi:hypothetical protein
MSHHFDTPTALEDPRINVCDFYLFEGRGGNTVMAMTVNPDAGISSPDTFREEGLYAFRFDLDSDGREELSFKVQFGNVSHGAGDEHRHVQAFQVRRARGAASSQGADGELLVEGHTGEVVAGTNGVNALPAFRRISLRGMRGIGCVSECLFQRESIRSCRLPESQELLRPAECDSHRS